MNTEAIIEKLLQIRDEQILNTALDDLDLSNRVYKSLWRSRVRTVGDVAHAWNCFPKVRNIGERARCEILGALQAWSCSLPNFATPDDADREAQVEADPKSPIEVLQLSTRTYHSLKRNRIETLGDIYREWDQIAFLRNVGRGTMEEIRKALGALQSSESVRTLVIPNAIDQRTRLKIRLTSLQTRKPTPLAVDRADPNPESHPATNEYENIHEVPTKKYVITDSGVVVNAELLQAEEPRKPRAERWRNVSREQGSAKPQDYAPKNIFQAIGQGENKISTAGLTNNSTFEQDLQANNLIKSKVNSAARCSPLRKRKKILDGSVPISSEWLEMSLYLLEKARTSRQVRTINCPICMAITLSIRFKKHLVKEHPQAFRELKKAENGSPGRQNEKSVSIVHTHPSQENHPVKCPLCEHTAPYNVLQVHIRDFHPEIDPGLVMTRFNKVHRSKDDQNLSKYRDELNQLVKEYEWLKRAQDEPRDGST